jgi:hypothetical protein
MAGINWTAVWLEPRTPLLTLTVGEWKAYTVMGMNGDNVKADLTRARDLKITSSDTKVLDVDKNLAMFNAKAPGKAEVSIAFSGVRETVQVLVKEPSIDRISLVK